MLRSFDWIRRCQTGAELVATLEYLATTAEPFVSDMTLGSPFSALGAPCQRYWIVEGRKKITTAFITNFRKPN